MTFSLTTQLILSSCVAFICWLSFDKTTIKALLNNSTRQIGLLACALVLALLWRIKAGILTGLDIHILGITAVTLILGWRLAIIASLLASALLWLVGQLAIEWLPFQLLFTALLPVCISYLSFLLCYHFLPRHFFIYIFVSAFITAAIVACIKIVSSGLFLVVSGYTGIHEVSDNYLIMCAIIWFPEAMLNGMAITLMITYRPHWVKTFYDKDYLDS